ncbi:hypothetical protein COY32_04510, partial [candidate division WWE3 bacterium CG_4_10_14_0_2_um_filter_41_14]
VTINTKELYDAGGLQGGCEDIRVVYQPNTTTAKSINYYFDPASGTTCTTSTATKVYFPLQANVSNGSSTSYYYLYYDNENAVDESSVSAFDIGDKQALMHCGFRGDTTCINGDGAEAPTTESGAVRYSGGKSALSFDGNDSLTINDSDEIGLESVDFSVEAWVYLEPNLTGNNTIVWKGDYGYKRGYLMRVVVTSGLYYLQGWLGDGTSNILVTSGQAMSSGAWHHVAYVRDGTAPLRLYIDGFEPSSYSAQGNGANVSSNWEKAFIGTEGNATVPVQNFYKGLIDEIRVSNTVRYTSNFTPSTSPFVPDEYTKLLLHFDENGDDPRNTGKAIDSSGNGNHGTITGAKYVGGLVGVDDPVGASHDSPVSSQSYAGHSGIFVEEGTVNKITNPSFENATAYNTNWGDPSVFKYDSTADTFTPGMAKRNSAGPFASGVMVHGKADGSGVPDGLSVSSGTYIGDGINSGFYSNFDTKQGSIVFWITPEWNGNDGKRHNIFNGYGTLVESAYKETDNYLYWQHGWGQEVKVDVSSWVAGATYSVVIRWDRNNAIQGSNYMSISVNDAITYGGGSAGSPYNGTTMQIGGDGANYPANAIIEGLTIYRRPLFDGTYGIDVGNGDEINQIYNAGTGKDPTLVTGSWDVVFALPTNASTGALTTGTGNAWSHPHTSNLLYTSTTNTGGFMMGADSSTDGWMTNSIQTLTIQPDATVGMDTYMWSVAPDTNYGNSTVINIGNTRGLISFDLASIPVNATVDSSTLWLYQTSGAGAAGHEIAYQVLKPWVESQATWNSWATGQSWTVPGALSADDAGVENSGNGVGADRKTTPIYDIWISNTNPEWKSFASPGLTALTQDWVSGVATDSYGFVVYDANAAHVFSSSDNTTVSNRPKLII